MKNKSEESSKISKKGRPKKDIGSVVEKKDTANTKKTNAPKEEIKLEKPKKTKKDTTVKKGNPEVVEKKQEEQPSEILLIYGNEKPKSFTEFKDSDLQLQIKNTINQYGINPSLLPQDILDSIIAVANDFNYFVDNRSEVGMIGIIMDKDLIATNNIKAWLSQDNRGDLLLNLKEKNKQNKEPNQNNTSVPESNTVVVNSDNINTVSFPANNTPPANTGIQNFKVHDTNPLIPRTPESTYQHNITPSANNGQINHLANLPQVTTEDKNIHYEILNKSNPYADAYKQQQHMMNIPQNNQQEKPVDKKELLSKYTETVYDAIKQDFRFNNWGYMPLDVVQSILNSCSKMYSYEVMRNGDEACISVSDGEHKFFTEKFIIK